MLTDFHVTLKALRPLHWPHFAGGRIRGAWGRALRQAACITGQPRCEGCSVRSRCAYGVAFDPAAPTQPIHASFQNGIPTYIVQPPPLGARQMRAGDTIGFTLRLLQLKQPHQQLFEHVMHSAVNQHLFEPGACSLLSLRQSTPPIAETLGSQPAPDGIHIEWHTPVRLQRQGKPLFRPQDLDSATLISATWRRQLQWAQLTGQPPVFAQMPVEAARRCRLDTQHMEWHDVSRYSNTQQKHLPLGGLLGSAMLTGPTEELTMLQPLLRLGELLHIGKETVFGLGRYELQQPN